MRENLTWLTMPGGFPRRDRSSESRHAEANNIEIGFKDLAE
jgi:hypothetical protein